MENRTLFPSTVVEVTADTPDRLLISGENNIKIGKTGTYFIRLYPGKECVVPIEPTATLYAIADTATCIMDYMIAQQ